MKKFMKLCITVIFVITLMGCTNKKQTNDTREVDSMKDSLLKENEVKEITNTKEPSKEGVDEKSSNETESSTISAKTNNQENKIDNQQEDQQKSLESQSSDLSKDQMNRVDDSNTNNDTDTEDTDSEEESLLTDEEYLPITEDDYLSFYQTADASDVIGKYKFDKFSDIMTSDITGTWYEPELGEAIRICEDGAYVFIPYLDYYGDTKYEWELIDRSDKGLCPMLAIYCNGTDSGPLAYYIEGVSDDYFWCNIQDQVFYRQ